MTTKRATKFIQVVGGVEDPAFALDEEGRVWVYDNGLDTYRNKSTEPCWVRLTNRRKEPKP
jgi:hypothetical protein